MLRVCVTLDISVAVCVTLDIFVARAIAVNVPHSASPQHLADRSLIRILGNKEERKQKPDGGSLGLAPGGGVEARS